MRAFAFVMVLLAAGGAYAQPVTYTLDPAHTQITFSVNRFGFNNVIGRFDGATGKVVLDEARPANSSVRATVQTGRVTLGDPTRDMHVRSSVWLNAAMFPTIEFRSTSVRMTGERRAEVTGTLTLLGQSHPVTLDVRLNKIGILPNNRLKAAGFSATGVLNRSTWGSTIASALIGDEVRFTIEALAFVPAEEN
jgi:polyisoprenoid-binding protein YceI